MPVILEFIHDPNCNCPVNADGLFYRSLCLRKWSDEEIAKVPAEELAQDLGTILEAGRAMFHQTSKESHDKYIEAMNSIAQKYTPHRMWELGHNNHDETKQLDSASK